MADSPDAAALRQRWSPEYLSAYDGQWIAFRAETVESSSPALDELLSRYADELKRSEGPLFAFVWFGVLQ